MYRVGSRSERGFVLDSLELSQYGMVPAIRGLNCIRQYNANGGYSEKVLFREQNAYIVEIDPYRRVQRAYGRKRFKEPTIKQCIDNLETSAALLNAPFRQRKLKNGEFAYQWIERWKRAELITLRFAALEWLVRNAACEIRTVEIDPDETFMVCPISAYEANFAPRHDGQIHVLNVVCEGASFLAAAIRPLKNAEPLDQLLKNTAKGSVQKKKGMLEDLMQQMWRYIPAKLSEADRTEYIAVGPDSPLFPDSNHIKQNEDGTPSMASWLRHVRNKKNRVSSARDRKRTELEERYAREKRKRRNNGFSI